MTYFRRPDQKSVDQLTASKIKNFQVFQLHLQKLLNVHQQMRLIYEHKILQLQNRKQTLLQLIEQSFQSNDIKSSQLKEKNQTIPKTINSKNEQNLKLTDSPLKQSSMNKSVLLNRSRILSKKQPAKQQAINYLSSMNEFKHKDLVQEVSSLLKQLNVLAKKNTNKQLMMSKSLLLQSKYESSENNKIDQSQRMRQQPIKQQSLQQQQQFHKLLSELGRIQHLPATTIAEATDDVLCSLLQNLQKQEERFVKQVYRYKQLQTQKLIKQNLQQRTVQNMRLIYQEKKKLQSLNSVNQVKSTKNVIKFGYTDKMLEVIKQKSAGKGRVM